MMLQFVSVKVWNCVSNLNCFRSAVLAPPLPFLTTARPYAKSEDSLKNRRYFLCNCLKLFEIAYTHSKLMLGISPGFRNLNKIKAQIYQLMRTPKPDLTSHLSKHESLQPYRMDQPCCAIATLYYSVCAVPDAANWYKRLSSTVRSAASRNGE